MAQAKVTFKAISGVTVKSKVVVVDKESNEKAIVTNIDFDIDADSSEFAPILRALAANHQVNVSFESMQLEFDETKE